MISPGFFADELRRHGIDFYAGVPDSLLKSFCAWLSYNIGPSSHIIAANEGAAVALAAGHFLASGRPGCVYMQNSGEGNAINPLASLTDADVYSLPVLLLIGWRGCPGVHDEPQHVKQGKVTLTLLEAMGIPYAVLSADEAEASAQIAEACRVLARGQVYALVVKKDTFAKYEGQTMHPGYSGQTEGLNSRNYSRCPSDPLSAPDPVIADSDRQSLSREDAIRTVASAIGPCDVIVSSTGMISRELFEYREAAGEGHSRDFLTVGSMGHASQIALGVALGQPERRVWCFDGDGAVIMHMGSMATVATKAKSNFVHVVFNNGAHDSVGGQPTVGLQIDLPGVARSLGYRSVYSVSTKEDLLEVLNQIEGQTMHPQARNDGRWPSDPLSAPETSVATGDRIRPVAVGVWGSVSPSIDSPDSRQTVIAGCDRQSQMGPVFIEVIVRKGNRPDLGRPTRTPSQNRDAFMGFLKSK